MSIRIYNGFAYDGPIGPFLDVVRTFREVIRPLGEAQLDAYLEAAEQDGVPHPFHSWLAMRREVEQTKRRNVLVDTDFSVTIFPCNALGALWIGIGFTEHDDWWDLWLQQPGIRDYHYQDATDPPEDVNPILWHERKKVWSEHLLDRPSPIPAMHGLSITVYDPMGPLPKHLRRERTPKPPPSSAS